MDNVHCSVSQLGPKSNSRMSMISENSTVSRLENFGSVKFWVSKPENPGIFGFWMCLVKNGHGHIANAALSTINEKSDEWQTPGKWNVRIVWRDSDNMENSPALKLLMIKMWSNRKSECVTLRSQT